MTAELPSRETLGNDALGILAVDAAAFNSPPRLLSKAQHNIIRLTSAILTDFRTACLLVIESFTNMSLTPNRVSLLAVDVAITYCPNAILSIMYAQVAPNDTISYSQKWTCLYLSFFFCCCFFFFHFCSSFAHWYQCQNRKDKFVQALCSTNDNVVTRSKQGKTTLVP